MQRANPRRFAFFVTPHGYGHAARACAVINALQKEQRGTFIELYTRVPSWFFHISLRGGYRYHELQTDIGLVQATSTDENLPETIRQLNQYLPFDDALVQRYAAQVRQLGCQAVLCDIAPLGIAVARAAGLPSILIENFTWDWIYEGYHAEEPRFAPFIDQMRQVFAQADIHIQTEPVCDFRSGADLHAGIVSRDPRNTAEQTRRQLGVPNTARLVMLTMGGILTGLPFLAQLETVPGVLFLVPGGSSTYEKRGSLVLIPHHSEFYHPDLVQASDAVIGKLGYSTLAEVYQAGVAFAFVARQRFRETGPMGDYAKSEMGAIELAEERFYTGAWLDILPDLLARPRRFPARPDGAREIAAFVHQRIARAPDAA